MRKTGSRYAAILILLTLTIFLSIRASIAQEYVVEINVKPAIARRGEPIVLFGKITPELADQNITLIYVKPSGIIMRRKLTTTTHGVFADSIMPEELGKWEVHALWLVHENLTAKSSILSFYVKENSSIKLMTSGNEASLGETIDLTGSISPPREAIVTIYYFSNSSGKWIELDTIKTDPYGNFSYRCISNETGRIYFKAYVKSDDKYFDAWSDIREVVVGAYIPTRLELNVNPSITYPNQQILIKGSLKPPIPDAEIIIRYSKDGRRWNTIKTLRTDKDGNFNHTWYLTEPGTYVIMASYKGGHLYSPAQNISVLNVIKGPLTLTLKILDRNGRILPGAQVILRGESVEKQVLSAGNSISIRELPPGTYRITVRYHGVDVYDGIVDLYQDLKYTISVSVYSLQVLVKDWLSNRAIDGVQVKIKAGNGLEFTTITDKRGYAIFPEVPAGNYEIIVDQSQSSTVNIQDNTEATVYLASINWKIVLLIMAMVIIGQAIVLAWMGYTIKRPKKVAEEG